MPKMDPATYPFPHIVADDLWDSEVLRQVLDEIPEVNSRWRYSSNSQEEKFGAGPDLWGPKTKELFSTFSDYGSTLSDVFGIEGLQMRTIGGGYHRIAPGGKLGIHTDFNRSPDGLYRRLNLLVYLNLDWTDADGGHLELWDHESGECAVSVLPTFNRSVIFETSSVSFHGHPTPLPGPRDRLSVAAYYFSPEPPKGFSGNQTTVFW